MVATTNNINKLEVEPKRATGPLVKIQKTDLTLFDIFARFNQWVCNERIIGMALLFYAGIFAFPTLTTSMNLGFMSEQLGMNTVVLSHWFLASGLYLLVKGHEITLSLYLLVVFPLLLVTIYGFYIQVSKIEGLQNDFIPSFVLILVIIKQMLSKALIEIASSVSNSIN